MIDFDEREATFARLRDSFITSAGAATAELLIDDARVASETAQANSAEGTRPTLIPRPLIAYDEYPVRSAYRLQYGFVINGQRVESLFFTEPSFADIADRVHGRISEQELHARMAGVDVEVLRALKWCDSRIATLLARAVAPDLGDVRR